MSPEAFLKIAIKPALALLPENMGADEAKRFMLAICLQESALKYRRQIGGPARGWPMFETNGVRGVLTHKSSSKHAAKLLDDLEYKGYSQKMPELHAAFEHNDALSLGFARLLIYTLPYSLPKTAQEGWDQYIAGWRPGKPHRHTWDAYWRMASDAVGLKL